MRYRVLACDYDGTIAKDGRVDELTVDAMARLRGSGRRLVLVTGRQLDDLERIFPGLGLFDRLVVENGAVVHDPSVGLTRDLAEAPPRSLVRELERRGVAPLGVGRVIIATWRPHEGTVAAAIQDLGLDLQVVFNKDAVMVLPAGVDKATGLSAALDDLGLSLDDAIGVGDAENDDAFLAACACSVAVDNALPALKARVDLVTGAARGAGVTELIDRLLATDLAELQPAPRRASGPPRSS